MNVKMKTKKFVNIMRKKECVKNPTIDIDHTVGKRVDCVVSFFSSTTIFVNSENNAMKRKS